MQAGWFLSILVVIVGILLAAVIVALEKFKFQRSLRGDLRFGIYTTRKWKRRILALAFGFGFLMLSFIGLSMDGLQQSLLAFVIYWWLTFTLALGGLAFPVVDLLETLREDQPETKGFGAEANPVVVRMIHELGPETNAMETPFSEGEDPPPTVH